MTLSCLKRVDRSWREDIPSSFPGLLLRLSNACIDTGYNPALLGHSTRFGCDLGVISISHENLCLGTVHRNILTPSAQIGEGGLNDRINSYDGKPGGPWTAQGTRVLRYMCEGWFWGTGVERFGVK